MKLGGWLAAGLMAWMGAVEAAPEAVVDAVQAPAWLERNQQRLPLVPGMALQNRDRLVTGSGARALVQLADGSAVKLGENVQVGVNALGKKEGGIFTAALDVAAGAFRLTTDIFRKYQMKRAINVRVGAVTAGIRGTDLWGRSDDGRDLICLLEGRIVVSHPEGEAAELGEPLQFYGADKGQPPGPVATADQLQLLLWARETEFQEDVPTLRRSGAWTVQLAVAEDQDSALALYDRARSAGYGVKVKPLRGEGGQHRYALRLGSLASEYDARLLAARLAQELELPAPQAVRR